MPQYGSLKACLSMGRGGIRPAPLPERWTASSRAAAFLWSTLVAVPAGAQELVHTLTVPQDPTILGEIGDVDLTPDGWPVVMDTQADVIYVFGREGALVRELGGEGQGPGEIMLAVEIEVGPHGEIVVADARNRRITRWSAGGELVGSVRFDDLFGRGPLWPHELIWSDAGLYLKASEFVPDRPIRVFRIPDDFAGAAELAVVVPAGESTSTCAFCTMTVDRGGRALVAGRDTLYMISALDAEGGVTRRWTRTDLPAVRRSAEEMEQIRARSRGLAATENGNTDRPGRFLFKTRFGPHGLDVDDHGRLWTAPRVADGEPGMLDVFGRDGTHLVTLRLGVPLLGFRIRGDRLVLASESPLGEPLAHVYRVVN